MQEIIQDTKYSIKHVEIKGYEKAMMQTEKMIEKRPTRRQDDGDAPHLGGPSKKGLADCFVVLHRIA